MDLAAFAWVKSKRRAKFKKTKAISPYLKRKRPWGVLWQLVSVANGNT
jgi:hypothetical protein